MYNSSTTTRRAEVTIIFKLLHSEFFSSCPGCAAYPPVRPVSFARQAWEETAFLTLNHREQPGVFILGGLEEILMVLEDNQVTLQTMMGSRFIMGVKDEVRSNNKVPLADSESRHVRT